MERKEIVKEVFCGERAQYNTRSTNYVNCIFENGESPLKESKNINLDNCCFRWKYPLWYCKNVEVRNTLWEETGRSGVWYTNNIVITDSNIIAPKQFRRCKDVTIKNTSIPHAQETLWHCENVNLENVNITGDYFGMNCKNVQLQEVNIDGNYCFDGSKNIEVNNCYLNSKDAFWNCENVTISNSVIIGEYFGWNSKNITLINCKIESHQGFCYIENLKLVNCQLIDTDLCFELCSNIEATIISSVHSIKNPINGFISCKGIGELIMDEDIIDPSKTIIEVR